MCGRFTLIKLSDLTMRFPWIDLPEREPPARYNIAPSQPILAATNAEHPRFDPLSWGLVPSWAKDPKIGNRMINARAETLAQKPSFRTALKRRRCLIPADGFYEWRTEPGQKTRTPMYIRMKDGGLFGFAGLWDQWQGEDGSEIRSCTIITTEPNEIVAPIHDRMPAILPDEPAQRAWLSPGEGAAEDFEKLLKPCPAKLMEAYEVSRAVNSPGHDSPDCVKREEQGRLF